MIFEIIHCMACSLYRALPQILHHLLPFGQPVFIPRSRTIGVFNRYFNNYWSRLNLAHEIAHTFFYNLDEWPPTQLTYLEPGNRDLEWLCDYISKCLLLPALWLRDQIERFPTFGSEDFSLSVIEHLEKAFLMPWQVILERLVVHLGFWKCVILQFTKPTKSLRNNKTLWLLKGWQTIPIEGTPKLYLRKIEASSQ